MQFGIPDEIAFFQDLWTRSTKYGIIPNVRSLSYMIASHLFDWPFSRVISGGSAKILDWEYLISLRNRKVVKVEKWLKNLRMPWWRLHFQTEIFSHIFHGEFCPNTIYRLDHSYGLIILSGVQHTFSESRFLTHNLISLLILCVLKYSIEK